MNSKTLRPLVAAAAALFNVAFMTASYAQAKAALTRDVDRATAQPATGACSAFSNGIGTLKCALYTVPAGKRLVVETVSYRMTTASGTPIYFVNFGEDVGFADLPFGTPNIFNVAPVFAYASGGDTTYTGTQALRMYVDENKVFAAGGSRGGSVNYEQRFSFSGYLVDK
jgi:hypothetical protein